MDIRSSYGNILTILTVLVAGHSPVDSIQDSKHLVTSCQKSDALAEMLTCFFLTPTLWPRQARCFTSGYPPLQHGDVTLEMGSFLWEHQHMVDFPYVADWRVPLSSSGLNNLYIFPAL